MEGVVNDENGKDNQQLLAVTREVQESLIKRGEELSYGNIISAAIILSAYKVNGIEFGLSDYRQNKGKTVDFDTLTQENLDGIKDACETTAKMLGVKVLPLSSELTIPPELIKVPRTIKDIENEVLEATTIKDVWNQEFIRLFRYTDSIGLDYQNQIIEPDDIEKAMAGEDQQPVVECARGLRIPIDSIDDARYSSAFSAFTIEQMLAYPVVVLDRTEQWLYTGGNVSESRSTDLLYRSLFLSQREMLAYQLQGSKRNTPYLSATLDDGGLRRWGRYREELLVPTNLTLNVRDISVQYDDVLALRGMTDEERRRLSQTIHKQDGHRNLQRVGGQQLDEIAILGGIRREWVSKIYDLDEDSVVWSGEQARH